jgi:hypothetical protein
MNYSVISCIGGIENDSKRVTRYAVLGSHFRKL